MEIQTTGDGSPTLFSKKYNETYHSVNGAITESVHVFIEAGLKQINIPEVHILEIGFGAGLNALLTLQEAEKRKLSVVYHSIEKYPVEENVYLGLNYPQFAKEGYKEKFVLMHRNDWNRELTVTGYFKLLKIEGDLKNWTFENEKYNLVYFDAFSPVTQPELWTVEIFRKIYSAMAQGAVMTTYCAKGQVRRNMQTVGFKVERLPGPPGKREMLRAIK